MHCFSVAMHSHYSCQYDKSGGHVMWLGTVKVSQRMRKFAQYNTQPNSSQAIIARLFPREQSNNYVYRRNKRQVRFFSVPRYEYGRALARIHDGVRYMYLVALLLLASFQHQFNFQYIYVKTSQCVTENISLFLSTVIFLWHCVPWLQIRVKQKEK